MMLEGTDLVFESSQQLVAVTADVRSRVQAQRNVSWREPVRGTMDWLLPYLVFARAAEFYRNRWRVKGVVPDL
jgi:hypothetical protein